MTHIHPFLSQQSYEKKTKERKKLQKTRTKISEPKKRFLSITVYDGVSQRHKFVYKFFKKLHIDKEKYNITLQWRYTWYKTGANDLHN